MCLAVPMQVKSINGFIAHCYVKGITRDVSLFLLQDEIIEIGDYLLIHVGYAIQKISTDEALSTWELLDQLLAEEPFNA
jgi:hydrogenase expression/formation protein HypC